LQKTTVAGKGFVGEKNLVPEKKTWWFTHLRKKIGKKRKKNGTHAASRVDSGQEGKEIFIKGGRKILNQGVALSKR